ncbi:MAG: hypothetical protein ACOYU6_09990 [Bacteroidota bacterium]
MIQKTLKLSARKEDIW